MSRLFPVGVNTTTTDSHQSFRKVNSERVRDIARDLVAHHDDYHLAAVTVTVEHEVRFVPTGNIRSKQPTVGELFIPLEARLTILDGVHLIFGLQRALKECPSLADDSIAIRNVSKFDELEAFAQLPTERKQ